MSDDVSNWVYVGTRSEMLPGEFRVVFDGDTPIAVYNIDGDLYAVEDVCTHDGGDLAGGEVHGFEVECPRHGARFDVRTGAVMCPPAYEPIASFPVKEAHGGIWTRDDR
ncbi:MULTISPECIES: non-heme iron oxygenase ferredoxin subunit [Dyella]|uniref:Non-heme iron oxygenase ferredoxin subunit n=2 Tax=Dyella TaxID=231454 RepID=A0A4V2NM91_9GAMM|nr:MULTISPECIES: non-heme iron oxygenase ferredoxin subunit [Dyella]TBR40041.1 non-heme iron oxygenase ferredoxin subunit [Dyella terrae]TCI12377.1 non-heme iron oxygenase ferredoxin subunit [Dyella soli]